MSTASSASRSATLTGPNCSGTTSLDWVTASVTYRTVNQGTANPALVDDVCESADFAFAIDMSGSIGTQGSTPSNLPDLKAGITGFVTGFQNAGGDGKYSGARFNGSSTSNLTSGYTDPDTFNAAVNGLTNPNGLTPTAAGIGAAAGNNGNDRAGVPNVLFVVTDGSPNKPNTHGDDLGNPDTWLTAANAAVAAADDARAGSGASRFVVQAVYLSTAGDPGDTSLPFSPAGDLQWATEVMDQIGGGTHLDADFSGFVNDLFEAIGCPPPSTKITKVADDATVDAGDQIGFTITVTNSGGKAAHAVAVDDNLPDTAGTNWSISPAVTGCSITGSPGSQALHCDFGTLNAGAHKSVHVVSGTGKACGTYDNTASFTSTEGLTGEASATVNVRCACIGITKVADADSVSAGDTIGFTITVTSKGPGAAKGVVMTDTFPTDAGTSWTVDGGTGAAKCAAPVGGVLSCDFGRMENGATYTVHLSSPTTKATLADSPVVNTASVTTTNDGSDKATDSVVVLAGSIGITKKADAASVSAGDDIGFTITVTSKGPGAAKGVVLTDVLPTDAGTSWTVDGGTGEAKCVDPIVGGVLSCDFGRMENGATYTVHLSSPTTKATLADSPVANTASVTTTNDGSDEATDSVVVLAGSIDITKKADAASVSAGDDIGFTITVTSKGPGAAKGVVLTDVLPTDAGTSWTVDGGTGEAKCVDPIVGGVLSCDFGRMENGATYTVHLSSPTTKATLADSPVANTASVTTTNDGSDEATDSVVVLAGSIDITKKADAASVSAGDDIGFTITVTSKGPGAAKGVVLTDVLPTDAGTSWTVDGGTGEAKCVDPIVGGVLSCDFGRMENGATYTVHLSSPTTKATLADSPVANTASVTTTNDGSDEATDSVVVLGPDIQVEKVGNGPISAGDTASFTITVSNIGPGAATNVTLTDTLPAGVAWTEDSTSCSITAGVLTCNFGTILPGASRVVTVSGETDVEDCGVIPNTASAVASNEPSGLLANNTDSASITVGCAAVVITKTADAPSVNATDTIGFVITVTNTGAGSAFGVTVGDTLPVNGGLGWSIDAAGSDAGWSIVGGVLKYGPATLASKASVHVHIVSGTTPASCGLVDNTASMTYQGGAGEDSSRVAVLCPDVTITKTATKSPILAGETASYTISARNQGVGTAYDVTISDTLPAGIAWTEDSEACSIANGILTCKVGSLAQGAVFSVTVSGPTTVAVCGQLPNAAFVAAANEATSAKGNNSDDASITVQCASISLVKTAGTAADGAELLLADPGNVVFTYVVTNTGTAALRNVVVVDDNATPADTSDDVTITCPKTTLAAGESMTCTATLPVGIGLRTNVATVTADPVLESEGEVGDTDDAVVRVLEPEVTPTPTPSLTLPPTSTISGGPTGTDGNGLFLILIGLAGLMLAAGYLVPAPARARRRNNRS